MSNQRSGNKRRNRRGRREVYQSLSHDEWHAQSIKERNDDLERIGKAASSETAKALLVDFLFGISRPDHLIHQATPDVFLDLLLRGSQLSDDLNLMPKIGEQLVCLGYLVFPDGMAKMSQICMMGTNVRQLQMLLAIFPEIKQRVFAQNHAVFMMTQNNEMLDYLVELSQQVTLRGEVENQNVQFCKISGRYWAVAHGETPKCVGYGAAPATQEELDAVYVHLSSACHAAKSARSACDL